MEIIKEKYLIFGNAQSVHLIKWVTELSKHFDIYVVSSMGVNEDLYRYIEKHKVYPLSINISSSGGNFKMLFYILKVFNIIKTVKPHYVNAHYITSHGLIMSLLKPVFRKRFKLILSAWGTDILVTPFRNKTYNLITKFILNKSDVITSDSYSMTDVIKTLTAKPVLTFPFGIDKLPNVNFEDKNQYLIFSNRAITSNYNIDRIIEWFNTIYHLNNNYRLVIANDGKLKSELLLLIEKYDLFKVITCVGFINQEEQDNIYRKAQFYISIPTSDSTSVSLIEAMSYGCIPIVSDIKANHEWIIDSENGFFFKKDMTLSLDEKTIQKIFNLNRDIIEEKAIFSKSISGFVEYIQKK